MPNVFAKRREPYKLRSRSKAPKLKVDACVECDLPFDESKISPELRRVQVTKEGTIWEPLEPYPKNYEGFDKTNLEHIDVSVEVDSEEEFYSEKERAQEKDNLTGNTFATGTSE